MALMTDAIRVLIADPDRDSPAVAAIYRPAVESSIASFEETAPAASEIALRLRRTHVLAPWLVAGAGESVVGYAYAGPHRERAGYRWSVDVSAYVDADWQGRRVGRTLCDALLPMLAGQGFV